MIDPEIKKALEHIDALIELAGLDKSESATETFINLLDEAVITAREEVERSFQQGLCFDCRWIVAETLVQFKKEKKARLQ